MKRFHEKNAIITGGGDLGEAVCRRLLEEGAQVVIMDVSEKNLAEISEKMKAMGFDNSLRCYKGDVRKLEDCEKVVEHTLQEFGSVDVLVATAGILRHYPVDELTERDWQDVIDINLTGVYHAAKSVVNPMKKQNYGRIVLISSIGGRTGRPGVGVNYAAAKAGIVGMTQLLGYELGPWNITVNCVAPGPLRGKMFESMDKEAIKRLEEPIRMGRLGNMDEVAAAIAFLASDESAWTTGEILDVNGGSQY